jgi:hypothetical protein
MKQPNSHLPGVVCSEAISSASIGIQVPVISSGASSG